MRLAGKMCAWFPLAEEILRMEKLCRLVGFDEWQTATLISGKLLLSINREPVGEWFRERFEELQQTLRPHTSAQETG